MGIDSVAGPSEVMVIADKFSNPEWLAIDLLSQAEHDEDARAILVTDSSAFINSVNHYIKKVFKKYLGKTIANISIKKMV